MNSCESGEKNSSIQVPNLDEIINQISANGEFKEMMNSLSEQTASRNLNEGGESSEEVEESDSSNTYDLFTTFFSDQNGNNICEILSSIDNSLKTIAEKMGEKN